MTVAASDGTDAKDGGRKLKAHKKSRLGCGNCKLRKVKCDERKPKCRRCESYGTFCNYSPRYTDLQPLWRDASDSQILQLPLCSEHQTTLAVVNNPKTCSRINSKQYLDKGYQLTVHDLELVHKFHTRTILTLGAGRHKGAYQNAHAKLTYSHPFLLHIVLTLTTLHDQYLGIGSSQEQSAAIAFHWSRGAALLNDRLSGPIDPSERDALWACAGLLGALSFASFQAETPEEAWPLKQMSTSDLDWLRMSEGKKEIRKIANPMREDSMFHSQTSDFLRYAAPTTSSMSELQKLPPELVQLCRIDDASTLETNPYLGSVVFLARTVAIRCRVDQIPIFLTFFGCMHPEFKRLVREKDPCALILLAYWYLKMRQCQSWWIYRRACLEGEAICRYLNIYHGKDSNISAIMEYLRSACAADIDS